MDDRNLFSIDGLIWLAIWRSPKGGGLMLDSLARVDDLVGVGEMER